MSMLPMDQAADLLRPRGEVAIVWPGPIQGDMVHPYLRRREGLEPVLYPKPELEQVLGKTLGVPLFQEQRHARRDRLRRLYAERGRSSSCKSMATFKFTGNVSAFRDKLIAGMVANGYEQEFAEQTFKALEGFSSGGFPEKPRRLFALIALVRSSWVKCWHPDVFCAALLNSQPMGFYAPAQIVRDLRRRITSRCARCASTLRAGTARSQPSGGRGALRGASSACAWSVVLPTPTLRRSSQSAPTGRSPRSMTYRRRARDARRHRLYSSPKPTPSGPALGLARREAPFWAIKALRDEPLPLFAAAAAAR